MWAGLFHSLADAQNQRSRGLPGFIPGAPDPDHHLPVMPSSPGSQVRQPGLLPPGNLPPGLEYLSQVFFSACVYKCFPLKKNTNWVFYFSSKAEGLQERTYWSEKALQIMKLKIFFSYIYYLGWNSCFLLLFLYVCYVLIYLTMMTLTILI